MSTKISALPASAGLLLTDIFPVVDDPGGVAVTQKATILQLQTLFSSGSGAFVLKAGDTMTGLLTIVAPTNALFAITSDAGTTNRPDTFAIFHRTSGVPAANFGSQFKFVADTDGAEDQTQVTLTSLWTVATNATRTSQLTFTTVNAAVGVTDLILTKGQVQALPGSVSAPGFTFQTDLDTGIYQSAVGNLGITVDGVNKTFWSALGTSVVGALNLSYIAKAATYTATASDYTIDATSGTFTVNLPTAVGITGRVYVVKNSGVGTITIDPAGAELIDGLATATLVSGESITTQSTGTGWIII